MCTFRIREEHSGVPQSVSLGTTVLLVPEIPSIVGLRSASPSELLLGSVFEVGCAHGALQKKTTRHLLFHKNGANVLRTASRREDIARLSKNEILLLLLPCRCTVPYAKDTIPLFILFRAMGFVADKEILQHIVYDFSDVEMLDLLRPSIEEAVHVTSEAIALDWIGRRIADPFMPKAKRIAYARDVLQKELLPHIGIGDMMEPKKAYFLGYMVHRMLLVALGRQPPTDRDSYAVKRLRMAGPLMADLFRCVLACCFVAS
jgi:DNA-directed RNA polymerase beta subunit